MGAAQNLGDQERTSLTSDNRNSVTGSSGQFCSSNRSCWRAVFLVTQPWSSVRRHHHWRRCERKIMLGLSNALCNSPFSAPAPLVIGKFHSSRARTYPQRSKHRAGIGPRVLSCFAVHFGRFATLRASPRRSFLNGFDPNARTIGKICTNFDKQSSSELNGSSLLSPNADALHACELGEYDDAFLFSSQV
jgi:hypothetical protein